MKQKLLVLARWVVGALFTFSGFVKGIDPAGLQYKLNDYLEALHFQVLEILTFPGAFLLPFVEFAFIFMLFFTPLTLYIALKNPVTDCGCFGDALVISNWQTFYKNIVLIILAPLLLINRKNLHSIATAKFRQIVFAFLLLGYLLLVYWSYNHEPIFDFRPYKVGANIQDGMKIPEGSPADVYQNVYHYRNRKSNKVKQFNDSNFPWQDTTNWKFESMDPPLLLKKGYQPPIHDFSIQTIDQENVTDFYLQDSSFTFLVIAYDLKKSSHKRQKELNILAQWAKLKGYHFIGLTSTTGAALNKFQQEQIPKYDILFTDQITLKTIIRSNPGLILLRKGTVIGKWHYNDFPPPSEMEEIISAEMNKKLIP